MKLSEAIMLGSATCKMVAGDINNCALGAALNAVGAERHTLSVSIKRVGELEWSTTAGNDRYHALLERWPWLFAAAPGQASWSPSYGMIVADLFDAHVVWGDMTLEQLADAVSAVEPQCECNQFDCDCWVTKQLLARHAKFIGTTPEMSEATYDTETSQHEDTANHDAELVAQ